MSTSLLVTKMEKAAISKRNRRRKFLQVSAAEADHKHRNKKSYVLLLGPQVPLYEGSI